MEPSSYSGAGGKIRRRPFSRASASATPYDRPPAAAAAHRLAAAAAAAAAGSSSAAYQVPAAAGEGAVQGEGGGWVSRLVDPASRLIAGGAARLFSTVFRKRLAPALEPPASVPPGRDAEPKHDLPESSRVGFTPAGGMAKGKDPVGTSGDKALSEVEHLLMRKTFTRVEFDRLTDLLRARTVESDLPAQVDHREDKHETRTRIDGIEGSTSHGMIVDHSPPADVPVRGVTSPADLAKQYMSSRYSKEPQPSSLRTQLFRGNNAEAGNTGYYRTSGAPLVQEVKELKNKNPGLPVNGYMASGLRGRSAICRMSRSPFFKGPSSSSDMNASPFSLSQARFPSLAADGRQALKRRGADFENELGSIGPIRRIRQKSNMMSHFKDAHASPRGNIPPSRTIGSDFAEGSSLLRESPSSKRLLLGTGQSLRTVERHRDSEDGKSSSDNVPPVPSQPNKMAEKIFEQLNIIAPSPKDKQSGQRSVAGNPSQPMSKQPVWQDNGPKGVSDPSSSRQFQDLDGDRPHDSDMNGSTLNRDKVKKDGSSKIPSNMFQDSGNKNVKSDHVAISSKPAILGNSVSATTSRKPGFKMAVFEDLYEFDDDQEAPVQSKKSVFETEVKTTEQKFNSKIKERKVQHTKFEQKVESTLSKENATSSSVSEQPRTSTSKDVSTSGISDPEKKATPHGPANNIGFTFPHVPPGDKTEGAGSAVSLASNKDDKQTSASTFMFGAKPSNTSNLETPPTAGVKTEGRLGESVTKPTSLDNTNVERGNGMERAGDIHKSPDKVLPTAPTSTPPLLFASAASTSPSLSNGLSHASPPKLSNVTPTDKPAVSSAPFTNITSFAVSSTSPPISSSVPAFPTFNFGSSTSAVAAAKSESTSTETKPASTLFGTAGTSTEGKSVAPEAASKTSSNLNTASIFSSNTTTFSSSPVTSTFSSSATFSPSPVASSGVGTASTSSAPSTTLATSPGVQSASAPAFAFSSSGNSIFGFSSPAQSTVLSTTAGGSTSQASAASTIFGSKLLQPQGTMSQSSATQFSSSFPTVPTGAAASSSGPGTFSFGAGASPSGSGTLLFGAGASSSGPGTVSFGAGASSSGPGSVSTGAGASSSGTGLFSFGAGVSSSGPGTVSFGAAPSSSAPGTVSFGVTTSSSGPVFGNSPFGSAAALSGSGSGFAFSSPSSSAASSLTVASASMFSSSSTASSSPAFSNPFGSASSTPSMFTFGQPASSGGAFSFGAQSAPAFSSPSPQVYSFTSSSMNSSTPQPAFGMTNANTTFGMASPGNDQMSMEDSMADDTNQAAPPLASAPVFGSSLFGQPASSPAAPVFGAPAAQPAGVFQFGGQQSSVQQNPSFPPAGGSVEFQGGNFSLGSTGGGDKSGRRIIKPKRTQRKK